MNKLATALALIAMAGGVGIYSPALAQITTQPAAGAAAGIDAGAGAAAGGAAAGVNASGDAAAQGAVDPGAKAQVCPDGTPVPADGACPPVKAGASSDTKTKGSTSAGASDQTAAGASDKSSGSTTTMEKGQAKSGAAASSGAASSSTSAASVNVTTEQQTTIKQEIKQVNVAPVTNINFNVAIGVAVPHEVRLTPLPATIVKIVPRFEGFLFFLLPDGRIVIVSPKTLEIVLII